MSDSESVQEELSERNSDDGSSFDNDEKQSVADSQPGSQAGSQAGSQVQVLDDDDGCPPSPTAQEIEDYADFLGIDVKTESDLMWIAKEGVAAPVPQPWKACRQGDEIFYFNFETKESIWDHPCDQKYRDLVDKWRKNRDTGAGEEGDKGAQPSEKGGDNSVSSAVGAGANNDNADQDLNDNSRSSFVSGAVESADGSSPRSAASEADKAGNKAPEPEASCAEEKEETVEDEAQSEALPSPSQKEMAAMWKAASGGLACSTPRSRESSSSRSSPRNAVSPAALDRFRSAGEVTVDPRSASKSSAGSVASEQGWQRDVPQSPASSTKSAADQEPAASPSPGPSAPDADTSREGNRGASFEAPSARSSCPSEVSEDFSFSAKSSPPGGTAPEGNSLEVSASASLDMMATVANAIGAGGLRAESRSSPKTWKELDADLKALEGVLDIIKKVREQQQDFLRQILG